jgi:hypothetical protein
VVLSCDAASVQPIVRTRSHTRHLKTSVVQNTEYGCSVEFELAHEAADSRGSAGVTEAEKTGAVAGASTAAEAVEAVGRSVSEPAARVAIAAVAHPCTAGSAAAQRAAAAAAAVVVAAVIATPVVHTASAFDPVETPAAGEL